MRIKLNEGIQFQSNVSIAGTPTTPTQVIAQPQQVLLIKYDPYILVINYLLFYLFSRHNKKFNKIILKKNVANF